MTTGPTPPPPEAPSLPRIKLVLRALRHRNFRLYFIGQGISLIGTWMQGTATGWMVYRLTDSAFILGVAGFAGQLPAFLFAPLAGVAADRWDRRKLLIVTQVLAMAQALALATLTFTKTIAVWHILSLSFLLGLINTFDVPGRQTFILDMVDDKEDLGNAIALQSSLFNSSRLIGPTLAGVLIATVGEATCFLLNAFSYAAILYALIAMKITQRRQDSKTDIVQQLKEGFTYTFGSFPIRTILLFLALVNLMGAPVIVLLPVYARDILSGGPRLLGLLTAAIGLGALMAALYLASRRTVLGLGRLILYSSAVFAAALIAFAYSQSTVLSFVLLFFIGGGIMLHMASSNTILQTIAEEDKRGRVMSFYTWAIMGVSPFGSLMAGELAHRFGAPDTLVFGGIICLAGSMLFAAALPRFRQIIRPIYMKKGIIPEMAKGIQSATELNVPPKE